MLILAGIFGLITVPACLLGFMVSGLYDDIGDAIVIFILLIGIFGFISYLAVIAPRTIEEELQDRGWKFQSKKEYHDILAKTSMLCFGFVAFAGLLIMDHFEDGSSLENLPLILGAIVLLCLVGFLARRNYLNRPIKYNKWFKIDSEEAHSLFELHKDQLLPYCSVRSEKKLIILKSDPHIISAKTFKKDSHIVVITPRPDKELNRQLRAKVDAVMEGKPLPIKEAEVLNGD